MTLCAGQSEHFDFAKPIGIGLVESAMQLTKLILEEKPTFLFFVGTAGSYGNYKVFDVVQSHSASNIELGFLSHLCYTPLNPYIDTIPQHVSRGTNHSSPIVNSSNYITTDENFAHKMLSMNVELENMEFFSVLSVTKSFNLPCSGLFIVTNYCNENAHHDFMQNHSRAKDLITLHVEKNMRI